MKRIINLIFIVFVIISLVFVGCNSSPDSPQPAPESQSEDQSPDEVETDEESSESISNLEMLFMRTQNYMDDGISYDQTMTMGDEIHVMRIWMKNDLYKTQSTFEGLEMVSLVNVEDDEFIVYYPQQKRGTVFGSSYHNTAMMEGSLGADAFEDQVDNEDFEYLGKETINGESCHVVITTDRETSNTIKMWISETYGIPMRMEMRDLEFGEDIIIEVSNITTGISDREFEVPSDIVLETLGG